MTGMRAVDFVRTRAFVSALGALVGSASCVQVLGIEDAHVDWDLERQQHGGHGGSTGSAGAGGGAQGGNKARVMVLSRAG